jgi:hypothetical protein
MHRNIYHANNYLSVRNNSDHLAVFHQLPEVLLDRFTTQFILPFLWRFCESLLLGLVPASQKRGSRWEMGGGFGNKRGPSLLRAEMGHLRSTQNTTVIGVDQLLSSGERRADVHSISKGSIVDTLLLSTYPSICTRYHKSNSKFNPSNTFSTINTLWTGDANLPLTRAWFLRTWITQYIEQFLNWSSGQDFFLKKRNFTLN